MCVFGVCDFEHIRFRNPSDGLWPVFAGGGSFSPCSHVGSSARGIHQISFLLLCHVRVAGHNLTLQLMMDHLSLWPLGKNLSWGYFYRFDLCWGLLGGSQQLWEARRFFPFSVPVSVSAQACSLPSLMPKTALIINLGGSAPLFWRKELWFLFSRSARVSWAVFEHRGSGPCALEIFSAH